MLELYDLVWNGKLYGIVIQAGPYGDDPFQVLGYDGRCHPFIDFDGKSSFSDILWTKVKGETNV